MSNIVLSLLLSVMSIPCLGNTTVGIYDCLSWTWINWLCGRYLHLQGFPSLQNLKSRQYEHLLEADSFLKAVAKCFACSLHIHLALILVLMHDICLSSYCPCPANRSHPRCVDAQQRECAKLFCGDNILPNLHDVQIWCIAFRLLFFFLCVVYSQAWLLQILTKSCMVEVFNESDVLKDESQINEL